MTSEVGDAGDAHGNGDFPGAFSVVLLSHHPFDVGSIRTFKHFLWKDAPDANFLLDLKVEVCTTLRKNSMYYVRNPRIIGIS
eukprot:scaffold696_cov197-Alexandrium_tamarense.AAC.16